MAWIRSEQRSEHAGSVLRSPLLPSISKGVAAMPPADGLTVMLRLISAMITGVALCAANRSDGHPIKSCANELAKSFIDLAEQLGEFHLENLMQLAEEVGTRIWHVVAFLADKNLRAKLEDLVSLVCQPVELVRHNHLLPRQA